MDPSIATVITAIIGAGATVISALIGAQAVKKREEKNNSLTEELNQLRSSGYRLPMLKPKEYGIDIVTPREYAKTGNSFEVNGTYKTLPEGQCIWTSTFKLDEDGRYAEYWPQSAAKIENGKWYGHVHNLGGQAGEKKEFLILVVGRDGDALFRHYGKVGMITGSWSSISILTSDIVLCEKRVIEIAS